MRNFSLKFLGTKLSLIYIIKLFNFDPDGGSCGFFFIDTDQTCKLFWKELGIRKASLKKGKGGGMIKRLTYFNAIPSAVWQVVETFLFLPRLM